MVIILGVYIIQCIFALMHSIAEMSTHYTAIEDTELPNLKKYFIPFWGLYLLVKFHLGEMAEK
jgi:hypothetical protein